MSTGTEGGANEDSPTGSADLGRGAIIGRYLVIGLLGRGGMGEVYAAYDPELDRKIALKLLRVSTTAGVDPSEGRARLLREAQAIARLSDPNVVVVFDVGTFADRVFLAMEFVDGDTLGYWLHARPRTWREVVGAFMGAGRGLACAHRAGVVHRDFKPDNVMLGRDGKARVMDFGLARSIEPVTPEPEVAEGRSSAQRPPVTGDEASPGSPTGGSVFPSLRRTRRSPATMAVPTPTAGFVAPARVSAIVDVSPPAPAPAGPDASGSAAPGPPTPSVTSPSFQDETFTRNLSRKGTGIGEGMATTATALNSPLTITGAMMGTPAYMAPEQFRGGKIDARSDQFSFCVALYEGLYGERPFPGNSIHELTAAVIAGTLRPAPRSNVPGWLRRTLLRGLRVDPDARFPSMEALLVALGRDPARTRRRWAAAASVAALIVLLAGGLFNQQRQHRRKCLGAETRLAGIWELPTGKTLSPRKEAIRRAFLATGKRYAADSFTLVMNTLDSYVANWTDMSRESCEATNIHGDQSAEVLDLRTMCLQDRLSEVRALTNVFYGADGEVVTKSVEAVQKIRPVEQCADIAALRAVVRPPDDPALRREVADIRTVLADLKALAVSGRFKQVRSDLTGAVERARRTNYSPLIAEALLRLGDLHDFAGESRPAEEALEEATLLAEGSRHDEVVAEAETDLVAVLANQGGRTVDAERWARHARAVLTRLGPGHDVLLAWLSNNLALTFQREGRLPEALATHLEALRIKETALGARHWDVGLSQGNVALVLFEMGRIDEAIQRNELALKIMKESIGGEHPAFGRVLMNAAEYANADGQHERARTMAERSLEILEREFAGHPLTAYPLTTIGLTYLEDGQPGAAIPYLERALRVREVNDLGNDIAETRFVLARALWDSNRDRERSLSLAELALADQQKTPGRETATARVEAWLTPRRARAQRISMR